MPQANQYHDDEQFTNVSNIISRISVEVCFLVVFALFHREVSRSFGHNFARQDKATTRNESEAKRPLCLNDR